MAGKTTLDKLAFSFGGRSHGDHNFGLERVTDWEMTWLVLRSSFDSDPGDVGKIETLTATNIFSVSFGFQTVGKGQMAFSRHSRRWRQHVASCSASSTTQAPGNTCYTEITQLEKRRKLVKSSNCQSELGPFGEYGGTCLMTNSGWWPIACSTAN